MPQAPIVAFEAIRDGTERRGLASSLVIAALMAGVPGIAQAADNWYVRADLGYSVDGGADISASAPIGGDVSLDGAIMGSAGVGYSLDNGWRIEGELARRENDLGSAPLLDPGGSVGATSLMLNAYFDFGGGDAAFTPYVGAGIGVANVQVDASYTPPLSPVAVDDEETALAYQVMAGVAISLSPSLDLDVGYRYLASPSIELAGAAPPVLSVPFEVDLSHHAVTAGLRWSF